MIDPSSHSTPFHTLSFVPRLNPKRFGCWQIPLNFHLSVNFPLSTIDDQRATSNSMSAPRPIHYPSREIRTHPDESEPIRSYDEPSPLLDEEDDFHNKLSRNRRESSGSAGGSFWRTAGDAPAFSSAQIKKNPQMEASAARTQDNRHNRSTGLLPTALQTHNPEPPNSVSQKCIY